MPTYDYRCEECGHEFELFQSITARPVRVCPSCRRRKVKRLIGRGAAVLFKGSGFYTTDYRSAGYKEAAKKDKQSGETKAEPKKASDSSGGEKPTEK